MKTDGNQINFRGVVLTVLFYCLIIVISYISALMGVRQNFFDSLNDPCYLIGLIMLNAINWLLFSKDGKRIGKTLIFFSKLKLPRLKFSLLT